MLLSSSVSQSVITHWIEARTGRVTFSFFRFHKERSWTLTAWGAPLQRNSIFTLKGRLSRHPLASPFSLLSFLPCSPLLCPPSCSPSPDEGRLHKSVTQEIPTLYFLSDKEPVIGDEFVAAGGFDRLWGNNKAISACQKSRRKEREKHTQGDINHSCDSYSFSVEKWDRVQRDEWLDQSVTVV